MLSLADAIYFSVFNSPRFKD